MKYLTLGAILLVSILNVYAEKGDSISLSNKKLISIIEKQGEVFKHLSENASNTSNSERDRLLSQVQASYEEYLGENAQDTTAFLLYAKFLKQTQQDDLAHKAYLKINQIDPNLAVVKQQLSNHLAETGEYRLAFGYILAAIDLEPKTAIYHYQLGELLSSYKEAFVQDEAFTQEGIDSQILEAFSKAKNLGRTSRFFTLRHAEAYFDLFNPNWGEAKLAWNNALANSQNPQERDYIKLQKARIDIELENYNLAKSALTEIKEPTLQEAKSELLKIITNIAKS